PARSRVVRATGRRLRRRPVPEHDRYGPPRLRTRRVQILPLSASAADRGASPAALRAARADRQRLAVGARLPRPLSRPSRQVPRPLPGGRPVPADPADPSLRSGRLQLPAPGRLRRDGLPPAGRGAAVEPVGFLGRRVRAHRTAAAPSVARPGRAPRAGRCRGLPGPRPPRPGCARLLSRAAPARRQRTALRATPYPRSDLPRRGVTAARD